MDLEGLQRCLQKMNLGSSGWIATEMIAKAGLINLNITEIQPRQVYSPRTPY